MFTGYERGSQVRVAVLAVELEDVQLPHGNEEEDDKGRFERTPHDRDVFGAKDEAPRG